MPLVACLRLQRFGCLALKVRPVSASSCDLLDFLEVLIEVLSEPPHDLSSVPPAERERAHARERERERERKRGREGGEGRERERKEEVVEREEGLREV